MTSSYDAPQASTPALSTSSDQDGSPRLPSSRSRSARLLSSRTTASQPRVAQPRVAQPRVAQPRVAQTTPSPGGAARLSASPSLVQVTIEWTPAARQIEGALDRRKINNTMRRAVRETLATAPSQHRALATYFKSAAVPVCEVGITISDDAEIAELNGQYRRKPRPTDVLSFAQDEGENFPFEFASENAGEVPPRPLGDIVISLETTIRQASEQKHSLEAEISFLTVHGTLHLLGFDHVTDSGRRAMWKWQDAIIERCQSKGAAAVAFSRAAQSTSSGAPETLDR
ncbi:MAG: putative rRNA maturation factor [Abditibacteriota bacterium]|nr:putative rRNA maturation factor [Abditibacteriota bacterium]